jgi:hypothetical protein
MPTGGDFVWVSPVKNFGEKDENDLRVPLDDQLMVTVFLSNLQSFHESPELSCIVCVVSYASNNNTHDGSLVVAENHSEANRAWITFGGPIKI